MAKVKQEAAAVEGAVSGEAKVELTEEQKAAAKAEKAAAKERNSNVNYVYQKDPAEGQKFAPQCRIILDTIKEAGTINRKELCKVLAANEKFTTKQPVERIVSYYQKDLTNAGLVSLEKAA